MNLASIDWESVGLLPETVRASGGDEPLADLIKVGRPVVTEAVKFYQASRKSDPLMKQLKDESDFYYVQIPLSFHPVNHVHLRLVSVNLNLQGTGEGAEAWSMEPQKVEQEIKVSLSAKIDAGLKLGPAALSDSQGSSEEYIIYQPVIEAFNLGRKDPAWEFRPSEGRRLSGIQVLHLVIRQPKRTASQCQVNIDGDAEDRRGIFRFFGRTQKTGSKPLNFTCP